MTKITDITSLIKKVEEINKSLKGQVWWRGQNDFSWKLEPSIFRSEFSGYREKSGARRFIQKAQSRHTSVPPISERQNWLFLMQHYGLPTRLLDWTESPLIACYFATESSHDGVDGAVYAISPFQLNDVQTQVRKLFMPYDSPATEIIDSVFIDGQENPQTIIAIRPAEVDIRLLTQISTFTLHGHNKLIEELPNSHKFIIKIKIPKDCKRMLRKQLKNLGIRESNIFPDLEHLAKEIKLTKFKNADIHNAHLEDEDDWASGESST